MCSERDWGGKTEYGVYSEDEDNREICSDCGEDKPSMTQSAVNTINGVLDWSRQPDFQLCAELTYPAQGGWASWRDPPEPLTLQRGHGNSLVVVEEIASLPQQEGVGRLHLKH